MRNADKAQAIIKEDIILEKAVEELRKISQDDIDRAWAESHYKFVTDEIAFRLDAQAQGEEKGLKKGKEIGFNEGKKESEYQIAEKMLKKNFDIDLIMQITELSKDEILKLKQD